MICPKCGNKTKVIDSRQCRNLLEIRRRRKCLSCKHRFTTRECAEDDNKTDDKKVYSLTVVNNTVTLHEDKYGILSTTSSC